MRLRSLAIIPSLALAMALLPSVAFAARGTQEAPRLMNLWFAWQLPEDKLTELAKWDVVVLDMDQQARYPDRIRRLRQLNPNIKILAYIDSCNIAAARFVEESNYPGYQLAHAIPESWYMHRGSERVGIWPGAWMLNVTSQSPTDAQGRRWSDFLPEFIQQNVWSTGLWDGIFLDNALDNATWFAGKGLDTTGDGQAEADATVDREWRAGWQRMAANLRTRLGSKALIMGNGSAAYAGNVNGILFENFPRYGWTNGFRDYQSTIRQNQKPSITAFNSNPNNVNQPNEWKLMRFTFASALLGDGYYSFDYGDRDHGQTWWYDEYDAVLGKATAPASRLTDGGTDAREGVWWRAYERGAVVVNSTTKSATVDLPGVFERLRGSQDPSVNNGKLETSLTLGAQEGLVVYGRTEAAAIVRGTAYRNGDFVRVYRADGSQARAGFFAQRAGVPGGANVIVEDVDRDGTEDVIVGTAGEVRISFGNGKSRTLRPFGTKYRGGISIAAGNTDRDVPWELVAANDTGDVRILELDGTTRVAWRPYGAFRGSISVAIGDVNGDNLREVITGAGPGGGPHVRIFKTDGVAWGKGWFAFDPRERGGVSITVGDVDGDGKDDMIAGSGQGTVPRVRTFSPSGESLHEFMLASQPGSVGVRVSLSDVDGDGQREILASGIRIAP